MHIKDLVAEGLIKPAEPTGQVGQYDKVYDRFRPVWAREQSTGCSSLPVLDASIQNDNETLPIVHPVRKPLTRSADVLDDYVQCMHCYGWSTPLMVPIRPSGGRICSGCWASMMAQRKKLNSSVINPHVPLYARTGKELVKVYRDRSADEAEVLKPGQTAVSKPDAHLGGTESC